MLPTVCESDRFLMGLYSEAIYTADRPTSMCHTVWKRVKGTLEFIIAADADIERKCFFVFFSFLKDKNEKEVSGKQLSFM